MSPSVDLNGLVSAFEGALATDKSASEAEVTAQGKFDAAQAALVQAKSDHVAADGAVNQTGKSLVAGIEALIAPFAPPPSSLPAE